MKIFLADPNPQVRSALRLVLSQKPAVTVTGETGDVLELLARSAQTCPDLILFDPELIRSYSSARRESSSLSDVFKVLHAVCPSAKIVAITTCFEIEPDALAAGADGFIGKTEPPEIFWTKLSNFMLGQKGDPNV